LFASLTREVYLEAVAKPIYLHNRREARTRPGDYVFESVVLFWVQDLQKLAAKCDTVSLLRGIKSIWNPSKMELLKSQVFVQTLRARRLRNPEMLSKKPA
jgi:hypothetical protein